MTNHTSGKDKDCEHVNKEYKGECFTCNAIADDISPEARKNLKAYVDKFAKSEPPINTIEEILAQYRDALNYAPKTPPPTTPESEATQAISTLITQARIEARAEARKQFFEEQHRVYEIGYVGGNYKILERTQNRSQRNRKFRVECIWCKSVMFRYSNKFKVKHKFCNNWRNENNRIKELSE